MGKCATTIDQGAHLYLSLVAPDAERERGSATMKPRSGILHNYKSTTAPSSRRDRPTGLDRGPDTRTDMPAPAFSGKESDREVQ